MTTLPLDVQYKEEEKSPNPTKADDLNFHNARLSKLLREQQFFQTQGNDFMVDKLQSMIEREIEASSKRTLIIN